MDVEPTSRITSLTERRACLWGTQGGGMASRGVRRLFRKPGTVAQVDDVAQGRHGPGRVP